MADALLAAAVAAAVAGVFMLPPVPQDPAYHSMADRRTLLGIPHALNVLSNVPFAVVGCFGLAAVAGARRMRPAAFDGPWHVGAYAALFGGVALTSIGSSYYHLAPDNERLVWDRLPMAVGFMGLVAAMLTERVRRGLARVLLVPLLALGAFSVAWWAWTEARGAGDLRLYGLVQFGSLAVVVLMLVLYRNGPPNRLRQGSGDSAEALRAKAEGGPYIVTALALYGLAKVFEALDLPIFEIGGVVSGHTLKHLAAAAGIVPLAVMIRRRTT